MLAAAPARPTRSSCLTRPVAMAGSTLARGVRPAALLPLPALGGVWRSGGHAAQPRTRLAAPPPSPLQPAPPGPRTATLLAAQRSSSNSGSSDDAPPSSPLSATAAVGLLLWAAFLGYALFLSPNQTPTRDAVFVQKLCGLGTPGSDPVNAVFTALWGAMGAWPAVYAALLIPAGRSRTGLPAWPFVTGSFALGAFALLPYFALHVPGGAAAAAPPAQAELESSPGLRLLESRGLAVGLAALAAWAGVSAATAGAGAWAAYAQLFEESRLVHVTSLDFLTLTACAWTWVRTDAAARKFERPWLGALAAVPLLGPAVYLCLRPRAGG